MKPALLSTSMRFYGCTNIECRQSLIPAEPLEDLVWRAYMDRIGNQLAATEAGQRHVLLIRALLRITVGVDPAETSYQWRAAP